MTITSCSHNKISQNISNLKERSKIDLALNTIEKISAIALGVFSLYTRWQLFIPFFVFGVCLGAFTQVKGEAVHHVHHSSSCVRGQIEDLTGVKLPRILSTIAGVAVTVCHIDHHAEVFVPIIGTGLGNWMGKTVSFYERTTVLS